MRIYFEQIPDEGKEFSFNSSFTVDETVYDVVSFSGIINRVGEGFLLDADISVNIEDKCDRCLSAFTDSFTSKIRVGILKESKSSEEAEVELTDEDMGLYIVHESIIDIENIMMQEAVLLRPYKRVCKDDCRGICPGCGVDLNFEGCSCKKEMDDRWKALSVLMSDKKE